ncbi:MAG: tripartite tricarboxylate transporter TctB family protein [Devosiaceae bacterium]|nr:tripartite tricarboxylate transporter TctB family protein [Devosiaceae bacterium MH13]
MTLDSAKADQWTGLVLFVLGAAMLAGGYTMDRLEIRQIHPASIPGLVPMILGAAMMLCAGLLAWTARGRATSDQGLATTDTQAEPAGSLKNLGFAVAYSVVYALGLVGNMPFAVATAIYIAVFYIHFARDPETPLTAQLPMVGFGVLFAGVGAFAIASLFQYGFLVRLP